MTALSVRTAGPAESARRARARARAWAAMRSTAWALMPAALCLAMALAFAPVLALMPPALQSLTAMAIWLFAVLLAARGLARVVGVSAAAMSRRMEAAAGLSDLAPLSEAGDRLVSGDPGLWRAHQGRRLGALAQLGRPPAPTWTGEALAGCACLAAALLVAGLQPGQDGRALVPDFAPLAGDTPYRVEMWAEPPADSGLPQIRLESGRAPVALPEGTLVRARLEGARAAPVFRVPGAAESMRAVPGGGWIAEARPARSGHVTIERFGMRARVAVRIVSDRPPRLAAVQPLRIEPDGRIAVRARIDDDRGLAAIHIELEAVSPDAGLKPDPRERVVVPLDTPGQRLIVLERAIEVADSPFAGLVVDARLRVTDTAGHVARGPAVRLRMPEPQWRAPLARALDRQRLVLLRERRGWSGHDAWAEAPAGVRDARQGLAALYGAVRSGGAADLAGLAAFRLVVTGLWIAGGRAEAHAAGPLLWDLVLAAEAGSASPVERALSNASADMREALERGAGPDALQAAQSALEAAVRARLAERAEAAGADGRSAASGAGAGAAGGDAEGAETVAAQLEALAAAVADGDVDEARARLRNLEDMLSPGASGASAGGSQTDPAALDRLMRDQRDLSDATRGDGKAGAAANGQVLARRQGELARSADAQGLGRDVSAAMRSAAESLRRGDRTAAAEAQDRAAAALQAAARQRDVQRGGAGADPLGRAVPGATGSGGGGVRVPAAEERRRVRDIRDELRRRRDDPDRPQPERDHLDRLLDPQ